ncbi:MAG TPA: hypothetical protein VMB50_08210 [Myxococcales bacterium]|nr:hypothetical protein [Myxococcales bacterium]
MSRLTSSSCCVWLWAAACAAGGGGGTGAASTGAVASSGASCTASTGGASGSGGGASSTGAASGSSGAGPSSGGAATAGIGTSGAGSSGGGSGDSAGTSGGGQVVDGGLSPALFGFIVNAQADTQPELPFGTWRIWDDQAQWPMLQPDGGAFVWGALDHWLGPVAADIDAGTLHDVLYTFMRIPQWAATAQDQYLPDGGSISCNYDKDLGGPRQCYPMSDVAWDGGGADHIWRNAVAQIGAHIYQALPPGTPLYWTLWDEIYRSSTLLQASAITPETADGEMSWEGSFEELVRVYQDASCILNGHTQTILATGESCAQVLASVGLSAPVAPGSFVLSPAGSAVPPVGFSVVRQFLYCDLPPDAGLEPCSTGSAGAEAVDGINFEFYLYCSDLNGSGAASCASKNPKGGGDVSFEEAFAYYEQNIAAALEPAEKAKPLFSAEGGWGKSIPAGADGPLRAAYLGRYYLLAASAGLGHALWYAYDIPSTGGLYDPSASQPLAGATAWSTVVGWLGGATLTAPCAKASGSYWTCGLRLADGSNALALWDSASTCDPSGCSTTQISAPAGSWSHYLDLAGDPPIAIQGGMVPASLQPILLTSE